MYLENIYVRPEYRGRGIGEKIMKELIRIAAERGYAKMDRLSAKGDHTE